MVGVWSDVFGSWRLVVVSIPQPVARWVKKRMENDWRSLIILRWSMLVGDLVLSRLFISFITVVLASLGGDGEEWSMCRCVGKVGNVGTGSKVV